LSEVEHAVAEACSREAQRLYANVRAQSLAFNVAPMLGLLGTVQGMIIAFYKTSHLHAGASRAESLAAGIYEALVCTFIGLLVAIPAGILAHFFEGRIQRLLREVEDALAGIVPQLERFEGRLRMTKEQLEQPESRTRPAPAEDAAEKKPAVTNP
jgi:biopolymer transport protein ExbB